MKTLRFFSVLFAISVIPSMVGAEPMTAEQAKDARAKAEALLEKGNWKEAMEERLRALRGADDEGSGEDFSFVARVMRERRQAGFDGLVEEVAGSHAGNWRLLAAVGEGLLQADHWGQRLDGKFWRHGKGSGRWVDASERDRTLALRFFRQALGEAGEDGKARAEVLGGLAEALGKGRINGESFWALGLKTDPEKLPDYDEDFASGSGAPVDDKGEPAYFDVPGSWEAAKSDGERLRWALRELKKADPEKAAEHDLAWAELCRKIYGVETLARFDWWQEMDEEKGKGLFQLDTLAEDETVARLANGVKRFRLREDYQYLPLLRKISRSGKEACHARAGDVLVHEFLHRRQFVAAARELREVIRLHGEGGEKEPHKHRKKLLRQITGNWGEFEGAATFTKGEPAEARLRFRNAKSARLVLRRLKVEAALADAIAHLESNPRKVDRNAIDLPALGELVVWHGREKYLGETVADREVALQPLPGHRETRVALALPEVKEPGLYMLEARVGGGNSAWIVVEVKDTVLFSVSGEGQEKFHLGDALDGAAVAGEVEFFGWRRVSRKNAGRLARKHDIKTLRFREKTAADGSLTVESKRLPRDYRWLVVARSGGKDGAAKSLALIGNQNFYEMKREEFSWLRDRVLGISDRPVYRPGQKVHVKSWARHVDYARDGGSRYAGKATAVYVTDPRGQEVLKREDLRTDAFGGVELDFDLPEDATLGSYRVNFGQREATRSETPRGGFSFRVEEYKKPEYEVTVEAPKEPVALGGKFTATVKAAYYHGAPVTEAQVKVTVHRHDHHALWFPSRRWDWLYGPGYWWSHPVCHWHPGWAEWGCVRPAPPWWGGHRWTPPELVAEETHAIGADGTVEIEVDTALAKAVHGDLDHRYEITAEVVDASRRSITGSGSVLAARQPFRVTTWLDRGYARPGERLVARFSARALDGQLVPGKSSAVLYRMSIDDNGKVREEKVSEWDLDTEAESNKTPKGTGEGAHAFPAPGPGQYRLAVTHTDGKGRAFTGACVFQVHQVHGGAGKDRYRFAALEIIPDKAEYKPGQTARLLLTADQPGARVWLFLRPSENGLPAETRVLTLQGQTAEIEVKLAQADQPNVFIEGIVISGGKVHRVTRELVLPPEKRLLAVEVVPAKERLKPREKTSVTLRVKDEKGKPFRGQAVLAIYDKSLEYISGGSNVPAIREHFWDWKRRFQGVPLRHSAGSFRSRNLYRMKDERMATLGAFGRYGWDEGDDLGGMRKFGRIPRKGKASYYPVTPALPIADGFGSEESFDSEASAFVAEMPMDEMAAAPSVPDGGEPAPEVMIRSEFADLLKWAGSIETDENGEAVVELEMPDNLTTWKARVWAMGHGTKVGEAQAEFLTSKDLIVRLQAPRFFVEKDEVTLSAIVHNYHPGAKEVTVSLECGSTGLQPVEGGAGFQPARVTIPSKGEKRIDWTVKAAAEGETVVRMKAVADDDSDAMEMTFPVFVHGIEKTESWSRALAPDAPDGASAKIAFKVPAERRPAETRLEIRYSPSIAAAMVDALPYLAAYPYGCTEQTLNRFVPTVITQKLLKDLGHDLAAIKAKKTNLNPQEIGDPQKRAAQWEKEKRRHENMNPVWDEKEVAKMVRAGVKKLDDMQNSDGGWGWFSEYGERSYPHTTAVVVHGLPLPPRRTAPPSPMP